MSEELLQKATTTGDYSGADVAAPNFFSDTVDAPRSGFLNPEQASTFIDYMWDATTLAKEGRRIQMRATTVDIDKIAVGQRVVRGAQEATNTGANADVQFTKVTVTTHKLRLDWETSTELVEDGIDTSVDDHIARLFATQAGNDIEDLAINGNDQAATGGNAFLGIMNSTGGGFSFQALAGAAHVTDWGGDAAETSAEYVNRFVFDAALKSLPRKYRANRGQLRFYGGSGLVQDYLTSLTNIGETPEVIATDILRGVVSGPQGSGGGTYPLAFGIPIVEVPLFNEETAAYSATSTPDTLGHVELTVPQNRIWGVKREIEFYSEFQPKKDTTEHTMYLRFGVQVENWDVYAVVKNIRVKGY